MREIKFRAWDKEKRKWIYLGMSSMLAITDDGHLRQFYSTDRGLGHKEYENPYVLLQFTGLRDKTGREIYEGDVVKEVFDEKMRVCEVAWNNEGAAFELDDGTWKGGLETPEGYELNPLEVIGNIYENPDLLSPGSSAD